MGLEAPLALLGLLAALLPLLAHRMRRRQLPTVVLPTFALLARAQAQRSKRSFTDVLLLMLRIAILATASLAIAAPYVTARLPFGDGRVAAIAIVIDDSLSMMRASGDGSLLGDAIDRAHSVASSLPDGSEVCVVLAGKPARLLVPLSKDRFTAAHELTLLPRRSLRGTDLDSAVSLAARTLSATRLPTRRLLVLSDFARHTGLEAATVAIDGVEVTSERLGHDVTLGNAFIESVHAASDPTQPGRTSIAVELAQSGPALERAQIELVQGGSVTASAWATFTKGHARATLQVPTPYAKADPTARVRMKIDDALAADNEAGVVLTRADAVRVLLVNGDAHPSSDSDELYYAQHALRLLPETSLSLAVRSIDPLLLPREHLDDSDVVVLANVAAPSQASAEQLLHFVEHGGGLIVSAGDHVDPIRYNNVLGALLPGHLSSIAGASDLRFREPRDTGFLPEGLIGLREARAQKRLLFDAGAHELLDFEDGTPAIASTELGSGRSLLLAVSLDADFSDLPLRPGYLPLLVAMIHQVSGAATASVSHATPGETVELSVPPHSAQLEVVDPEGHAKRFPVGTTQRVLSYADTLSLGAYQVRAAPLGEANHFTNRGSFVVVAPKEESDLTAGVVPDNRATQALVGGSGGASTHRPLGSFVFLLAGVLALLEGFFRTRKPRSA